MLLTTHSQPLRLSPHFSWCAFFSQGGGGSGQRWPLNLASKGYGPADTCALPQTNASKSYTLVSWCFASTRAEMFLMMLVLEYRCGHVEGEASSSPRVPALPRSDVRSQKSAVRDFDERGEEREGRLLGREGGRGKGGQSKIPFGVFSLSAAPFYSLRRIFSYLLPLIFRLTRFTLCVLSSSCLALTHVCLSRRPHTRLQLGKIQRLPPFPDSFQFGTEPPGHCGTAQCLHTPPY